MSLGPVAGGLLAQHFGFCDVFLGSAAFALLSFWLAVRMLPVRRSPGESRNGLRQRHASSNSPSRTLVGCWLATLGGCVGLGTFVTFVPLHGQAQGLSYRQIGAVFMAQAFCNAVSRIPVGRLIDRFPQRKIWVAAGLMLGALAMAGFGYARLLAHFMGVAALLGCGMALAFTSLGALIAGSVPASAYGIAMGGYNMCIYFGITLGAAVMGVMIERLGCRQGFVGCALAVIIATALFWYLLRGGPQRVRQ
jgi:predicted MFS family arabinose efflux permease